MVDATGKPIFHIQIVLFILNSFVRFNGSGLVSKVIGIQNKQRLSAILGCVIDDINVIVTKGNKWIKSQY